MKGYKNIPRLICKRAILPFSHVYYQILFHAEIDYIFHQQLASACANNPLGDVKWESIAMRLNGKQTFNREF